MFLMIGVNDGQNALYYEKLVYFTHLGKAVNVTVFVTFTRAKETPASSMQASATTLAARSIILHLAALRRSRTIPARRA